MAIFSELKIADFPGLCVVSLRGPLEKWLNVNLKCWLEMFAYNYFFNEETAKTTPLHVYPKHPEIDRHPSTSYDCWQPIGPKHPYLRGAWILIELTFACPCQTEGSGKRFPYLWKIQSPRRVLGSDSGGRILSTGERSDRLSTIGRNTRMTVYFGMIIETWRNGSGKRLPYLCKIQGPRKMLGSDPGRFGSDRLSTIIRNTQMMFYFVMVVSI